MGFFKLIDLRTFYFSPDQYTEYGSTINELYSSGYTIDNLYECGYTVHEIYDIPALKSPISIGIEFLRSKIDISYGLNGLNQIINTVNYPLEPLFNYYTDPLNNNKSYEIQRLFQLYSINDLYSNGNGFGISFMKYNNIPISMVYPLIANNTLNLYNLKTGDSKNLFINGKYNDKIYVYTLLDFYSLNIQSTNIKNSYESFSFTINDFYNSGFTALQMKNAGINSSQLNPRTLYNSGYTLFNLYDASYNVTDFSNSRFTIADFLSAGFSIVQIVSIFGDIKINDYIIKYRATLSQVILAGFSLEQIYPYRNNYIISDFINNGFSIQTLYNAGFTISDFYTGYLVNGIPTIQEILNLHYNISLLIPYDISIKFYYNSQYYSSLELFNNGFLLYFLKNYYSLVMFKNDLIPLYTLYLSGFYSFLDFKNVGYILTDLYNVNIPISFVVSYFTVQELLLAGYSINQIITIHYFPVSVFYNLNIPVILLVHYYTTDELLNGGYSRRDLNIHGNNITHYCCNKKSILFTKPTILGSSSNQTTLSSKMAYSQNINSKKGGSYTSNNNNNNPNIPALCVNQFNTTTASAANSLPCLSLNIPSKTSASLSYFIRNYIEKQVNLYHQNISLNTAIDDIQNLQNKNPKNPIFNTIQNYFDPSIPIIFPGIFSI